MFRKEKLVLFPYIKKCLAENKKTQTCTPFKTVKLHATHIFLLLQTMKRSFTDLSKEDTSRDLINDFDLDDLDVPHRPTRGIDHRLAFAGRGELFALDLPLGAKRRGRRLGTIEHCPHQTIAQSAGKSELADALLHHAIVANRVRAPIETARPR